MSGPALSAVVATPAGFDAISKTVSCLRAQDRAGEIELVAVGPEGFEVPGDAVEGFHSVRRVDLRSVDTTGKAMAAGFRAATAPLLSYVEEHSYPRPGWAAALIEAHEGPWAAVGASVENANPESLASWTMFFLDFAPAIELRESGETTALPSHHTTYKRAALEGHSRELHQLLEVEAVLQAALRDRGDRLYMASGARQEHVNVSRPGAIVPQQYLAGLQYAPLRIREQRFSLARRLGYAAAAPLIVAVQFWRTARHVRRAGRGRMLPRLAAPLLLGLAAQQAGESVGYLTGRQAGAPEARQAAELNRSAYVRDADAEALR